MKNISSLITLIICLLSPATLLSGQAQIEDVKAECDYKRICKFSVTIRHADEGWAHFANGWTVSSPEGALLAHRALAHPHVNEQPFTRSIRGIKIPPGVDTVVIRANDSVHGESQRKYIMKLTFSPY